MFLLEVCIDWGSSCNVYFVFVIRDVSFVGGVLNNGMLIIVVVLNMVLMV